MYFAHSLDGGGDRSGWQRLRDHLLATSCLAAAFAEPFGCKGAAALAGLLHDLGKYTPEFQARLSGVPTPVDHSTGGADLVRKLVGAHEYLVAHLIAHAIAGHHAGLPDTITLEERIREGYPTLDPVWREELSWDTTGLVPNFKWGKTWDEKAFQLGFLGRMLFSCLVDADFKDTEQFYNAAAGTRADRDWPTLPSLLPELVGRFDAYMADKQAGAPASALNDLRRGILDHLRQQAERQPGLFTLTVPTGGGKTLASLGFALDHARQHGLTRIIYAIPFTSIIDQTASIFEDVLGQEIILEHHSAIEEEKPRFWQQRDKLRLAMEDWAAPIILTTNVQLFESLFANRPSRCRKLHHLANSVIILDEAQTLPLPLLKPCMAALDELARNYGTTIILCTATQPALDQQHFSAGTGLPLAGRELAPAPEELARQLRRVTLVKGGVLSDEDLVQTLADHPQALVIVNSRKHALALYRTAQEAGLEGLVHLSTRQHGADRRALLAQVRKRLEDKQPCRLIATSLVEAGVDLDFPRVWRAEAGLDQIAQAAGRCNREGKRPVEDSIVTIFAAPDNPPPHEIAQFAAAYGRIADKHQDHFSPAALTDYFTEVYWSRGEALDQHKILGHFKLDAVGLNCDYATVAGDFRMIDSGMVPVIINTVEAQEILKQLAGENVSAGKVARQLQPYLVAVPPKARALLLANKHLRFEREQDYGDQFAVLQTTSFYDQECGLLWEQADYLGLENSVW